MTSIFTYASSECLLILLIYITRVPPCIQDGLGNTSAARGGILGSHSFRCAIGKLARFSHLLALPRPSVDVGLPDVPGQAAVEARQDEDRRGNKRRPEKKCGQWRPVQSRCHKSGRERHDDERFD